MTNINTTLGEIVAADFRTAEYFKKVHLDFCCGGNLTLEAACLEKDLNPDTLLTDLNEIMASPDTSGQNFKDWDLGFLCDYIQNTHHLFVIKNLPDLEFYTQKISSVHGEHHPELQDVARLFQEIAKELSQHLEKEEGILFPAIKSVLLNGNQEAKTLIASEIQRMSQEHEFAGGAMDEINRITKNYLLPEDACNTYQLCFKLLRQFEDDLHIHVHLENNILFKKALTL